MHLISMNLLHEHAPLSEQKGDMRYRHLFLSGPQFP